MKLTPVLNFQAIPFFLAIFFLHSIGICQSKILSIPCSDSSIESKRWKLDSIDGSRLYDSLNVILAYFKEPIWLEFSSQRSFYGSDGCNGVFGNFIAYDKHLFFYDVGSQAGLCMYNESEKSIRKVQHLFKESLGISRYECYDSTLIIKTVYGVLFFKNNMLEKQTNDKTKKETNLKGMYQDLDKIKKENN